MAEIHALENFLGGSKPRLGNQVMSWKRRMDAIGQPEISRRAFGGLVKDRLQRHEDGVVVLGDLADDFLLLDDFLTPILEDFAMEEHKWLQKNELHIRVGLQRPIQKPTVEFIKAWGLDTILALKLMPDVVDADKDAEDIWLQVEGVKLPAGVEVHDAVARDGTV